LLSREIVALVEGAMDNSWQSAQEIADRLHIRPTTVREVITRLEVAGKLRTHGERPIRYGLRGQQAENSGSENRSEYRGEPRPYMRPGSYVPPARPTITLADGNPDSKQDSEW